MSNALNDFEAFLSNVEHWGWDEEIDTIRKQLKLAEELQACMRYDQTGAECKIAADTISVKRVELEKVKEALHKAEKLFPRGAIFENAYNVHVLCDEAISILEHALEGK